MTGLLVALGAGPGAAARFVLAGRLDRALPWGTLLVNVAGSFLLGLLSALSLSGSATALLGVGFCGGFTTWSALAVQAHERGPRTGTAYLGLTLLLAPAACVLGHWLG